VAPGFQVEADLAALWDQSQSKASVNLSPFYASGFATDSATREVHSATGFFSRPSGQLHAYWYGGTREGATDVCLYTSSFDPQASNSPISTEGSITKNHWSASRKVICPETVQADTWRFTRKIGNPVAWQWEDGEIWLFFVSVSVGGWGGSSINLIRSSDNGLSWSETRKLVTSPLMNISTLVRGTPFKYQDGTLGLPVYHESIGKFGELLRIDRSGRVLAKQRLSRGTYSLQPEISPLTPTEAVGFLRYGGPPPEKVLRFDSLDSGISWSRPEKLELPNPNAAVASLALNSQELLLVYNDTPEGRVDLALGYSGDKGLNWQLITYLEFSGMAMKTHSVQYAYPTIIPGAQGEIHVLYSYNREAIKHVRFNLDWVRKKLAVVNPR